MRFKAGVFYTIPGIVKILMASEKVYNKHKTEVVITSLMDGTHKKNSKHYSGEAADLRIWAFDPIQVKLVAEDLKKELGKDYDVVIEGDHIHIEYDPKD